MIGAGQGSRLRPIDPFDLEIVATLHAQCFEEAWGVGAMAELLAMPGAFGLLAEAAGPEGEEPAGFVLARVAAGDCEILSIGVVPDHRRTGLGRILMQRTIRLAVGVGARRIFLEVAEDNWAARRLYAGLGFAAVGLRPRYYRGQGGSVAALTMRRIIARS